MTWCDNQCLEGAGAGGGAGGVRAASSVFTGALQILAASQCLLTEPWPSQASLHNGSVVDVIIVGGGTGGSALAARLAETNLTVLLLEAGPDPPIESIIPGFRGHLLKSRYDWNYTTVDDHYSSQELLHHRQRLRLGRLLGGTGSINVNIYCRGFPEDFDEWADLLKDPTWNWDNVLPYFIKFENLTDKMILDQPSSQKYHGTKGEIEVAGPSELSPQVIKMIEAYKELGFKVVVDRNNPEEMGAFHLSFNIKNGKKHSSLTAMLNKVADRENLYVMKNAFVTKILIKGDAAFGLRVLVDNKEFEFYAKKEVILSAGAYNTPKLLMLSGIGPKEHLLRHGIQVVKDLPVGDNLHDHFSLFSYMVADSGICDLYDVKWEAIKYLYDRTGRLSIPNRMGVDFALKGSLTPSAPDFSVFTGCIPKSMHFYEECLQELNYTPETCLYVDSFTKNYDVIPATVLLRKPKSRGSVRLASADPSDKPVIRSNAFSNDEDLEKFIEATDIAWSITNSSYFKSKNAFVLRFKLKSCKGLEGRDHVKCMVKSLVHSESHAAGTAAMGAVVDGRLRVRGVRRLRVVDASVMPTVPRENTNAAVIMIAEKAADFIKQEYGVTEHYHM